MNEIDFGKAIKKARKSAGMTQAELAKSVGVSLRTMNRYERNSRGVPLGNINKLSNALGITPEDLITGNCRIYDEPAKKLNHYISIAYESDNTTKFTQIKIKDKDDPIYANDCGFVVINGLNKTLIFNVIKIIYMVTFATDREMEDVFGDEQAKV